jgi:hypothetical protein
MDLSQLKAAKAEVGSVLQLKHPGSEKPLEGVTITLLGTDSKKYRTALRRKQQASIDRTLRGKKAKLRAEEVEQESLEDLAECTVTWSGGPDLPGVFQLGSEKLECNKENAIRVFTELPWIKEQASEFMADRENFI